MQFDNDTGPAFTALSVPYAEPLTQPTSEPTTLFGGHAPAVQFAPVEPIHPVPQIPAARPRVPARVRSPPGPRPYASGTGPRHPGARSRPPRLTNPSTRGPYTQSGGHCRLQWAADPKAGTPTFGLPRNPPKSSHFHSTLPNRFATAMNR